MQKMTFQDLKDMYWTPAVHETPNRDGLEIREGKHAASKKRHRHQRNPVWLPGSTASPAEYRRRHLGKQ